MSADELGLC